MLPTEAFQWYDSFIFIVMLLISTSIGVYYGCFGTKQATPGEYLMGKQKNEEASCRRISRRKVTTYFTILN
jgi:hypothetical protein